MRNWLCLFGNIVDGQMYTNPAGEMVTKAWDEMPGNYAGVDIDSFVLMPTSHFKTSFEPILQTFVKRLAR